MNQEQAMKLFPIGSRVQIAKDDVLSSTGTIDDLYPVVLGTITGYAERIACITPDRFADIYIWVAPENLIPFPLSG